MSLYPALCIDSDDYGYLMEPITFLPLSPQGSLSCINFTIIGDTIYEPDESFFVLLTPANPWDTIAGQTIVTIVILSDDEREYATAHNHIYIQ